MKRLDELRGNLKHHGALPTDSNITSILARTQEFFESSTPAVFGLDFSEISLVQAVPIETTRTSLLAAEAALEKEDPQTAVEQAAIALEKTLRGVGAQEVGVPHFHRFDSFQVEDLVSETGCRRFARFAEKLRGELDSIYRILQLLTLGIDLQRYMWFGQRAPEVIRTIAEDYFTSWAGHGQPEIDADEARECIDFVTETALAAHEMAPPTS